MSSLPAAPRLSTEETLYLLHHVFLPPKLPQEDDYEAGHENVLLASVIDALSRFQEHTHGPEREVVAHARVVIARLRAVRDDHGDVNQVELRRALETLEDSGGALAVHVRCQNAAVLMTRHDDSIHVESFELSPRNKDVNTTVGRLQRQFPGPTFAFNRASFTEPAMQITMAQALEKMSRQPAPGTLPKVKKAGQTHDEDRDTTNPMMVTELFLTFLRPQSRVVASLQVHKNTREEVLWLDTRSPWRRSALWLQVRVTIQLVMRRLCEREGIQVDQYKPFMIFYMCCILRRCSERISSEHRYIMNSKIVRRLRKLDIAEHRAWLPFVQSSLQGANDIIRQEWGSIIARNAGRPDMSPLTQLNFRADTDCSMPSLDEWRQSIRTRRVSSVPPNVHPDSGFLEFEPAELPSLLSLTDPDYVVHNLAAFEAWVDWNLQSWTERHVGAEDTCERLSGLITEYYGLASTSYASNPEALSTMLLTILELWIACDKSAVHSHPLLGHYHACIPIHLFESLLLPHLSQLIRLARAESYLSQRHQGLRYPGSNILTDFGTRSSFAVRFFDQSAEHRTLFSRIEQEAASKKAAKVAELHQKHQQYRGLCAQRDAIECTYYDAILDKRFHFTERRHSLSCERCGFDKDARAITIEVHEWPLSSNPWQAQATVFELKLPRPFAFWRDVTAFILLDVLGMKYASAKQPRAEYRPQTYHGLSRFFTAVGAPQRIGLLSQDKPHLATHRKKKLIINVCEKDVCLPNGMHLEYFDNTLRCFTSDLATTDEMATACTYKLPPSSSSLQPFLFRPPGKPDGPSPNTVIASQHTCPEDMPLGEYKALCSMPLGLHIQWQNILRQLAAPSVTFNKVETCLFIWQIIHQAGPSSPNLTLREGHHVLNDNDGLLAAALLREVKKAAVAIEENWQSAEELSVLIALTQKLLACSPSTRIQEECIAQLASLRKTSFKWVMTVGEKAGATDNNDHRNSLLASAAYRALICAGTFDCENGHLERMLRNDLDASMFIQCSMIIHDRRGVLSAGSNCLLPIFYHRWQNIAFRGHRILADEIVHNSSAALDQAIQHTWAAYRPGSPWSAASRGRQCCLNARMMGESGGDSGLLVHVNLLTGQLLINGRPLARLPAELERHDTYCSLFGHSLVEVMPSDLPGLEFSARRLYMGQKIHIGAQRIPEQSGFDLCIRAMDGGRVWEFVPPRLLANALPDAFVEGYAHWYEVDGQYIEFRPVNDPWKPSPASHWRLQHNPSGSTWCLTRGNISLISMDSPTAKSLLDIFKPIEKAPKVHCKLHHGSALVEVEIPRLRLSFNLRLGQSSIESRQYRGMIVDPDQSMGTLIGLRNMLVLLDPTTHHRRVLVPEGPIKWKLDDGHVTVHVGWQATTRAHVYRVNNDIGCLTDNGTLQSKLVLCYLHAVTSFCIPDPLTKHTGTEQALSILRSASMRSFNQLQPENISILEKLASLTPTRRYYPADERVMQSVGWDPVLGCLAQHNEFHSQVVAILDQHHRMRMFHPGSQEEKPSLPLISADLGRRDRIRSSTFRISGFGAEDHTIADDCPYEELGRNYQSESCSRVFTLCEILYKGIPSAQDVTLDSLTARLWRFLTTSSTVYGANSSIDSARFKYDAMWLIETGEFFSSYWCSIHRLFCSEASRPNRYAFMLWLSTLAFSGKIDMAVLHVLAAMYILPGMASITLPAQGLYRPQEGFRVNAAELKTRIHSASRNETPESNLSPGPGESYETFRARVAKLRKTRKNQALGHFIAGLQRQWPTRCPSTPMSDEEPAFADYFDTQIAMQGSQAAFSTWFDNRELRRYLDRMASIYTAQEIHLVTIPPCLDWYLGRAPDRRRAFVSVDDILDGSLGPPPVVETASPTPPSWSGSGSTPDQNSRLWSLADALESQVRFEFQRGYIERLRASITALQDTQHMDHHLPDDSLLETVLSHHLNRCQEHHEEISRSILSRMLLADTMTEEAYPGSRTKRMILGIFASVNVWPRVSSHLLLHQLTRHRWIHLPEPWKECLVAYGCSVTALQRAKRLVKLIGHRVDLVRELQNPGHTNWNPIDFPESLLLEIESGVLIRDVQEEIAQRMRNAQPGRNIVMQLNMGEGKSSVIVPIVAAALADGSCLVRIIVAKPQSRQMFQMLVAKLGGLLGRRVYHLPVSRSLQIGQSEADEIERMCQKCMAEGGVLLVQPEHILSLKLMCLECSIAGKEAVGVSLSRILDFFRTSSRDVVDESDENFSVKFELIYTMGTQRPLELSPQRWTLIQQMLDLVRDYAPVVRQQLPRLIEVDEQCPGSFPRIRLLHADAGQLLFREIADHICQHGADKLPISRQPEAIRRAAISYCLNPDPSKEEMAAMENPDALGFWTNCTRDPLLLLRGLLAGNVLAFCLGQKRWRVNYGLDRSRQPPTRLAVPYRAKDSPAPRAEFSHPDVVIVLTCLSYYYEGLCDDDLFRTFDHLIGSDQADAEYQMWVDDAPSLPSAYRQLVGVNLQDRLLCVGRIFPSLRFAKGVIDYFLAHIIFAKGLREFPSKLSSSGWDIGEIKGHPTVGFSGTNDSRVTLPLRVEQLDLSDQNHTNALVLEYLLRPETAIALLPAREDLSKSDAQVLLDMVAELDPAVRVILDVGAQILELNNLDVAKTWLEMIRDDGRTRGVVFINDDDEIAVVDRTGLVEPLQTSPFERHLDQCLVFLDEAHTRGIDLRLPQNYRAAVTLGPNITKDKLVQACMRMRKLGSGQSVVFCIPEEIKFRISALCGMSLESDITVPDVLRWAIAETWDDMQRSIPLWASQGKRYQDQARRWRVLRQDGQRSISKRQAEGFLEPESQSLEQRYRPCRKDHLLLSFQCTDDEDVCRILDRCRQFATMKFSAAQLQEEQERELAPEIEQERQVQRPAPAEPELHFVHPDIRSFVATGCLDASSTAVEPAFMVLQNTSAAKYLDMEEFPSQLLVTKDFAKTVRVPDKLSARDSYQRAVEWVLVSTGHAPMDSKPVSRIVIISPYEANKLHASVCASDAVTMHLYAPRQNHSSYPLDKLDLYPTPTSASIRVLQLTESLRIQLNLFAGQLYISSYNEYLEICRFLGVATAAAPEGLTLAADGFIVENQQAGPKFTKSPLKFLMVFLSQIRKDGQEIDKTHLGKILDGKLLLRADFQDCNDRVQTMNLGLSNVR